MEPENGSPNLEERLKSLLALLEAESGVLERLVYKNKNQHRRCPYFRLLLKVRSDLRLLKFAKLEEILNALSPIVDGRRPAQKAYLPNRQKKNELRGKHSDLERLLGVARLLSQMAEPILKAAIQISLLLAKSFFTTFSLAIMSLLARLRVLVQQMLLDVVTLFNKVSSLSQERQAIKVTQEGIEAFREYYPLNGDVLTLESVWEEDKFVLLEMSETSKINNQNEDQSSPPLEASIQYETIPLFSEAVATEHEQSSGKIPDDTIGNNESCSFDMQSVSNDTNATPCQSPSEMPPCEVNQFADEGLVPIPQSPRPQAKSGKKAAFIRVGVPKLSEEDTGGPSKKMKLDSSVKF